jgi:elongation factor Ts
LASTIEKIKQLREETAAGMMDVKNALEESGGDLEGARLVFREFAHNVALHVASAQPQPLAVAPEDISAAELDEERRIVEKQVAEMGKPEEIASRIVEGRMQKWISERALLTQPFVKDLDKTVGDILQETVQKVGENVVVRRFVRYAI